MNQRLKTIAIPGLRWTLGLVVLLQSFQFTFSPSAIRHFAQTGLAQWARPALAGSEIIAAPFISDAGCQRRWQLLTAGCLCNRHRGSFPPR